MTIFDHDGHSGGEEVVLPKYRQKLVVPNCKKSHALFLTDSQIIDDKISGLSHILTKHFLFTLVAFFKCKNAAVRMFCLLLWMSFSFLFMQMTVLSSCYNTTVKSPNSGIVSADYFFPLTRRFSYTEFPLLGGLTA